MDDFLTKSVLDYQTGAVSLETVRNQVLLEAFAHLSRYRRKGEDEVSEFLLEFHGRVEGLLGRFRSQGLPFRHFLLRTLRWQWTTFRADRARARRQAWMAADLGLGAFEGEYLTEAAPGPWGAGGGGDLSATARKRLVLLALKAAPYLGEAELETVSLRTGADLAWLQACRHRLQRATAGRRARRAQLDEKRGEAYCRRISAEDEARLETDPDRRRDHERRAALYRTRLSNLTRRQDSLRTAPTHRELSNLLGIPKGSIDSGLYHLKKEWGELYSGGHEDPPGHE